MSSAAESEVTVLFMNAQHAVLICLTLKNMGHPQPPTSYILITLLHKEYYQVYTNKRDQNAMTWISIGFDAK